eukprot:149457-Prymnesium_polylepis.1
MGGECEPDTMPSNCPGNFLGNMEVYDPLANKWAAGLSMRETRWMFGVGVLGEKLYAVGGNSGRTAINRVEAFIPAPPPPPVPTTNITWKTNNGRGSGTAVVAPRSTEL